MKQIAFEPSFEWLDWLNKKLDKENRGMFFKMSVCDKNASAFDTLKSFSYSDNNVIIKSDRRFEIIGNNDIPNDMCKLEEVNDLG